MGDDVTDSFNDVAAGTSVPSVQQPVQEGMSFDRDRWLKLLKKTVMHTMSDHDDDSCLKSSACLRAAQCKQLEHAFWSKQQELKNVAWSVLEVTTESCKTSIRNTVIAPTVKRMLEEAERVVSGIDT